MNLARITLFLLVIIAPHFLMAQETVSDSSQTDSLKDSTLIIETLQPGEALLDELTEFQRKVVDMSRLLQEFKAARQLPPRLSF